jgi:small-conductance mechanosensitive channel
MFEINNYSMILENPWLSLGILISISLLLTTIIGLSKRLLCHRLQIYAARTTSKWDDVVVELIKQLKPITIFTWLCVSIATFFEHLPHSGKFVTFALTVITLYQVLLWGLSFLRHWRQEYLHKFSGENNSAAGAVGLIYAAVQFGLIATLALVGLSHLGVDIAALIAGLGVGGIAVALAAQNILGDLLASLSIILDKPFVVGDFIVVGTEKGTVEQIGIKTTRVRSVSGEQLIFANKDLLESRISNFKRMTERRVVKQIGVEYGTPNEKLKQIPIMIETIIKKQERLRFERCHFYNFGASSLDFEFVFWVLGPDYQEYMDAQEIVLRDLYQALTDFKVEFAYPSQTVYLAHKEAITGVQK